MCGIIAFNGSQPFDPSKIKSLFLYNAQRGTEGCGMYNAGLVTKTAKDVYAALPEWNIVPELTFIGHTRKASYANYRAEKHAHPFKCGNIVGVHNGSLTNHVSVAKEAGIDTFTMDTDTEMLFNAINKDMTVLKKIVGTASLAFVNIKEPNTLMCFRKNDERPLFRGKAPEGMYISSLKESLEFIGCKEIEEFKTKCLYNITGGKVHTTIQMPDEVIKTTYTPTTTRYTEYEEDRFARPRILARRNEWVKVYQDDTSCHDNHGRIKVGEFYQLEEDHSADSVYMRLRVYTMENGKPYKKNKYGGVLYKAACAVIYRVYTAGTLAIAMNSGKEYTNKGDIVYVSALNDETGMLTFKIVYPEERAKQVSTAVTWNSYNFRAAQKDDIWPLWEKYKLKLNHHILNFLVDRNYITKQERFPEQNLLLPASDTAAKIKMEDEKIAQILTEIRKLNSQEQSAILKRIRGALVAGQGVDEAIKGILADLSAPKIQGPPEIVDLRNSSSQATQNQDAEEDDFEENEDSPPVDSAFTSILKKVYPEDVDTIDEDKMKDVYIPIDELYADVISSSLSMADVKKQIVDYMEEITYGFSLAEEERFINSTEARVLNSVLACLNRQETIANEIITICEKSYHEWHSTKGKQ